VTGDRALVVQAMLADPFTSRGALGDIEAMTDELLDAHRPYLALQKLDRKAGTAGPRRNRQYLSSRATGR
jgi:hypothetical protein